MKQYQRKGWLWSAYIDEKRSARDMADECGCSHTTIYRHLRAFNIPVRAQLESIKRKQPQKQKKKITMREYLLNLNKLNEILEELKETQEIIKALKGEESEFYVSESQAEQNRLKAGYRARAKELQNLRQQIKQENLKEGGSWSFGTPDEQMRAIEEEHEEPTDRPGKVTQK